MGTFITALTGENGINATAIWGAITPIAPLVVTLILAKLGYNVLRSTVNDTTRIKSKRALQ